MAHCQTIFLQAGESTKRLSDLTSFAALLAGIARPASRKRAPGAVQIAGLLGCRIPGDRPAENPSPVALLRGKSHESLEWTRDPGVPAGAVRLGGGVRTVAAAYADLAGPFVDAGHRREWPAVASGRRVIAFGGLEFAQVVACAQPSRPAVRMRWSARARAKRAGRASSLCLPGLPQAMESGGRLGDWLA